MAPALLTSASMPPKMLGGAGHGQRHGGLVAHVQLQGQGAAAGGFDFFGDAEDGAGQLRVGIRRSSLR
jgi:hypothetical protein